MKQLKMKITPASAEHLAGRADRNATIGAMTKEGLKWHQAESPAEYRRLRAEGIVGPKPVLSSKARTVRSKAHDGQELEIRVVDNVQPGSSPRGVFVHFHAGGLVTGSASSYDTFLETLSSRLNLIAASVEYRLAPEHPYPTPHNDAVDAVLFACSPEGEVSIGAPVRLLVGDSAGAHLAVQTALRLRDDPSHRAALTQIRAVVASYGQYDISMTPSCVNSTHEAIVNSAEMGRLAEAAFPGVTGIGLRDPGISPLYADLAGLPPCLFLCGTEDVVLDDSMFMANRWAAAGNEAALVLAPGAWHGFTLMVGDEAGTDGIEEICEYATQFL